jgi:hypothetical protein
VRRLFTWLAGAAGGLAAYRAVTRRTHEPAPVAVDPAEELRAKLAEARSAEVEVDAAAVVTEEPPAEPEAQMDADSRRRAVHEGARATLDEMHGDE